MSAQKDLKRVLREAEKQGWRVERTKKGHWKLLAPDGIHIVHVSGTPEGSKAIRLPVARTVRAEMELRVRVTTGEHGRDPANGERFLEGFLATHPEAHPVVSQNVADGTLTVSFSVEADDAFAAGPIGGEIFTDGATASGLPVSEVVDVAVTLADVGSEDEARELQPA